MNLQGMAVAWMRKEDWPRWLAIDPKFQPDYEHWLRRMEAAIRDLQARGVPTVKITIDPGEFIAWLGSDAGSPHRALSPSHQRSTYAALKAMELDKGKAG